ncbi:hypothetical protein PPERSA_11993 [Pseudocohnilembus persalinus]|uniref:Serine/threonine-protein phosphatase n=1 Tax=Pseudocohnilembus persalinus TaxID=266149 RepID=A0A0V0QK20_PSEPJ|nr:hypothetical protein PPERSA_11993 [Pseudocohnilembus persalinus]|eukprot:KRX02653.1 hypothetical protein PPERSA_11993 [Pseudocohnilembus persalinus]
MSKRIRELDNIISQIKLGKKIPENEVTHLCEKAKEIMSKEKNVLILNTPIHICGDIHGQFYDLLELFKIGGDVPDVQYCFLGDYVDRGYNSVETMLLFIALKIRYPDRIYLIRGNHESRLTSMQYGFYTECKQKYGTVNVWKACVDLFDFLPLAAIIDKKIFCVHGGLSPQIDKIDQINDIERFQDVPNEGPMTDLLWSDPDQITGWGKSQRGAGYLFGADVVDRFNYINDIDIICRAHQIAHQGFQQMFNNKLVIVWSAPNYMYRCGNLASILEIDENQNKSYNVFDSTSESVQMESYQRSIPDYFL